MDSQTALGWVTDDEAKLLGLVIARNQCTSRQLVEALGWSNGKLSASVQSLINIGLLTRRPYSNDPTNFNLYECPQQDAVRAWLQANHPEALLG